MNDVTQRLAEMLGVPAPTGLGNMPVDEATRLRDDAARDAERYGPAVRPMQTNGAGASPSVAEAAAAPWSYTGRGPSGKLRNFRAMNDLKLLSALDTMITEANDVEGLRAIYAEAALRGHRDPAALDAWLAEGGAS